MEKLNFISAGLFLLANIFGLSSVALPDWLITEIERSPSGPHKVGLLRSCVKIAGRSDAECYLSPNNVEWLLTLICIFFGTLSNFGAIFFFFGAHWRPTYSQKAKWFGVASVISLCIATIIFPAGFNRLDVGGAPYQLPRNCHIGLGYIFFMLSLWTIVVAELLNAKIFGQR